MKRYHEFLKKHATECILAIISIVYSTWLMTSTFSYKNGSMYIATKAWSDFASHIPLIRSFSFGLNFPPQYPLFSGEPIHYHFLFYFFVGMLERLGLRIDIGLNLLSIIGFVGLLMAIYYFAYLLFSSKPVALLSVLFFVFNGSLGFVYFFTTHQLSLSTFHDIVTSTKFSSFGPYDGGIVSAFWNMNIYTNQRHFAFAMALSLFVIYFLIKPIFQKDNEKVSIKTAILLGVLLGCSFFFHIALFLMTAIVIFFLGVGFKKLRIPGIILLSIAGLIALPQYWYLNSGSSGSFKTIISTGYLVSTNFTFLNFIWYWFNNIGLHLLLIPLGFILAHKDQKKVFISFFFLFIIGNVFQFSSEMAANHKFFNYLMIVSGMYSAYALNWLWRKNVFLKPLVLVMFVFLILSGIFDFFPVYNDVQYSLADYKQNKDIQWIMDNTPPSSIILNTSYLYTIPSLAGRRIFLGWPYFSWSQGYDTTKRSDQLKEFFELKDKESICRFLKNNNLSYVYLEPTSDDFPYDNLLWKDTFNAEYTNPASNVSIINTKTLCTP